MSYDEMILNAIADGQKFMVLVLEDGKQRRAKFFDNRKKASDYVLYWNKKRDKHVHAEFKEL